MCHSDGGEGGRVRLRVTAFTDDCPAGCGGFTIWPRSHAPIWDWKWQSQQHANCQKAQLQLEEPSLTIRQIDERTRGSNGYSDQVMDDVKHATEPIEVAGPAGTVVLWHGVLAHIVGQNRLGNVIRQAVSTRRSVIFACLLAMGPCCFIRTPSSCISAAVACCCATQGGVLCLLCLTWRTTESLRLRCVLIWPQSIYDYSLTPEALPDEEILRRSRSTVGHEAPALWDDWSEVVQKQAAAVATVAAAKL